jgi:hypothetical protein
METRYAYSLNGSDWTGEFKTRKDARHVALEAAKTGQEVPGVVYVGKIVTADAQTRGHAQNLVWEMSDRANRMGTSNYLVGLKVEQMQDLEHALARTLGEWLDRNNLRPTHYTVEAISEYPVPMPSEVKQHYNGEVVDLGPETF